MPKLRLTLTAVIEFETEQHWYEADTTPEQMIKIECSNYENSPEEFFERCDDVKVVGEVVND